MRAAALSPEEYSALELAAVACGGPASGAPSASAAALPGASAQRVRELCRCGRAGTRVYGCMTRAFVGVSGWGRNGRVRCIRVVILILIDF